MSKLKHGEVKITSALINNLLQDKHDDDVFVPECKDGPTVARNHLRMDAWVMKKSWANPLAIGYEIKVSRSDFLQDTKWRGYLNYCNQFYFVCPSGMIKPEELDEGIGLMYVSKTGGRLTTKVKARHRDVQIPDSLYRYILMSRTAITSSRYLSRNSDDQDLQFWKDFAANKDENEILGHCVSHKIARLVSIKVYETIKENGRLEHDNKRLEIENKRYDDVKKFLNDMGVPMHYGSLVKNIQSKLSETIPRDLHETLDGAIRKLQAFSKCLDKYHEQTEQEATP